MGRLPALIALLALAGCDESAAPSGPGRSRSDAVLTSATPSSQKPQPTQKSSATPGPSRKLCEPKPVKLGEELPEETLGRVGPKSDMLPELVQTGAGKWTWVNLWAGWCKPCKEEMPLLLEWERKLSSGLRVAFVSIDDDLRLSEPFLASLDRPSYHLAAEEREAWLRDVGLGHGTKLPSHILVDPAGKIRCVVKGAIEASDYAELEALVKAEK